MIEPTAIATIISTIISSLIAAFVAVVLNRRSEKKDIENQLDSILDIAIQYPYPESRIFTENWTSKYDPTVPNGQCSYDSKGGAVYIDKLISVAKGLSGAEFMTVGQAHQKAAELTTEKTISDPNEYDEGPQYPEARLPKSLSTQQLIISINPIFYYRYG